MDRIPLALESAVVRTPQDEAVRLADAWSERTAVLAFVRHFG